MLVLASLLLFPPQKAVSVFDAAERAHARLKQASVEIVTLTKLPTGAVSGRTKLQFDARGRILMRVVEPAQQGKDRSDRTYYLAGSSFIGYDAISHERLRRTVPATGERLPRLARVMGQVDDAVRILISPAELKGFFAPFRKLGGWSVRRSGGSTTLTRTTGAAAKQTVAGFTFGPDSLLRVVAFQTPQSTLRWNFTYSPGKPVAYVPPSGARLVNAFLVAPEPPRYYDAAAERVAKAMLRAYSGLSRGIVTVSSSLGQSRLVFGGGLYREDSPDVRWTFDGKVLTIEDRTARVIYRGITRRSRIPNALAAVGLRVDPLMGPYLNGSVPFQTLFSKGASARLAGSVVVDGMTCDILQVSTPQARNLLAIRRDNRLLASMSTDTLVGGRTVSSSTRRFQYALLGQPMGRSEFTIKPGVPVRPLPKGSP